MTAPTRVAQAVSERIPPHTIERIWLFAPVRREWREWGTAVIACRLDSERLRVHTGSYLMVIRGRERGQGKVTVDEVGESPVDVLHEVIAGVQERAGEAEPPVEIDPELWYPREQEEPADPPNEAADRD